MDKLREHFEHELSTSNIPYKELADENTLNIWFEQFCNAPKIPSLWLYTKKYYTDNEVIEIIEEANDNIPESKSSNLPPIAHFTSLTDREKKLLQITRDFHNLQVEKVLTKQYYINDITQTFIAKALYRISETRNIFLDSIYDDSTDRYKEPKDTSDIIIEQLERLPLSFASAIIQDIREDDANMHVFIIKKFGDRELSQAEDNKLKKMNNSLIQLLWDWEKSKNNETQKEKDNENKRLEGILLREKTYTLPIDFWEETTKTEKYKHTTQTIRSNDFLGVHYNNTYFKIYSEGICYLSLNEVEAIDKYKNEKVKIECSIFYDDYLKGYLEGIEYFNKNHNVSPDTLYGENAKTLVQDLHYNLCHKNHKKNGASFEGWISCKNKYPLTFSNKTFEAYGYYAGILNQLTNLVEQYPVVFDKYNICPFKEEEHDNNSFTFQNNFDHVNSDKSKEKESNKKKYPAKYYALLHWIKIELGLEVPFELNSEGRYSKKLIREFARNKYPEISNQQFYKEFIDLDITNKAYIATIFGQDYKEILIKISENNAKIIRHLKDFPN